MRTVKRSPACLTAIVGLFLVAACDQPATTAPDINAQFKVDPPGVGEVSLCKTGTAADFTVSFKQDTAANPTVTNVHLTSGQCQLVAVDHRQGGTAAFTITENVAPTMVLDSILNDSITVSSGVYVRKIVKGTNVVSGTLRGGDIGFIYTFLNHPVAPSLHITKTADADTVNAGSNIGFTITVNNSGNAAATNVQVTDNLPTKSGISWSESPDNPNCSIAANVLSCTFASLAAGASATVHVTSPTTTAGCGSYPNTASFTSGNGGTGSASDTTNVKCPPPPPSLHITKVADADTVNSGSNIGFTISVNNSGGSAATNVQVTDNLPTGTGITWSESPDNPNCSIAANVLSCTFASLAAGATATVHVTSPTTEASCGTYGNTASFTSGNAGTGSASDTTVVKCPPPPSGEGCTPGFWKQDHHLDSWVTFSPSQLISSVFNTSAVPNLGSQTLQQGLSFKGGPDIDGGAQILLRAAIASLLNSTALNFSLSSAQIIAQVNTALTSGSRAAMIALGGTLDGLNNGRCPLN